MNEDKLHEMALDIMERFNEKYKIAKEYKLDKAIKEANLKEFDKWFNKLLKKNGTTNY